VVKSGENEWAVNAGTIHVTGATKQAQSAKRNPGAVSNRRRS
jgi:hypothetical protein